VSHEREKQEIIFWGAQLHRHGINYGRSGNMSRRVGNNILITAHESYLGFLQKDDILIIDKEGNKVEGDKEPTSEKPLHLSIYQQFPQKTVVIHVHPPHTVHYFHYHDTLTPITLEERVYLGKVKAVTQQTATITTLEPVHQALGNNDIVVIKDHGVVAVGENFQYTFSLIELLEVNARVHLITMGSPARDAREEEGYRTKKILKKYKLFSQEHIAALIEVINNDKAVQSLGKEYDLTTVICTKVTDGEEVFSFRYEQGKIVAVTYSEDNADFIFAAAQEVWKKIFAGDLDPFVAKTQGKIKLKGDFNRLSRWFPVFDRTFGLWRELPLES
jgi:ribulose-5-phosphate 4-epimerase/fuculose-1-phosphate aldolase